MNLVNDRAEARNLDRALPLQRVRARASGGRPRAVAIEQRRRGAAANDNDGAWPERPFHLCVGRAACSEKNKPSHTEPLLPAWLLLLGW